MLDFQRSYFLVILDNKAPVVFFTCLVLGTGLMLTGVVAMGQGLTSGYDRTGFVGASCCEEPLGVFLSLSIVCMKLVEWEFLIVLCLIVALV